ncbi:MAG: site-2 protease family protein [Vulcanimicrobiaceae bacterium]
MSRSLPLARLCGIRVRIHWSWLPLYGLVTWSVATTVLPYSRGLSFAVAAIYAILLFGSLVLHELAHALVARTFGVRTRSITLFLFGGVATLECEPPTPRAEVLVAAAGPVASAVLAGFCALGAVVLGPLSAVAAGRVAGDLLILLAWGNAAIAVFNLIPAFPMDGGRILHALLWRVRKSRAHATAIASLCGLGLGMVFAIGSLITLAATREWQFGWYLVLSSFLIRTTWQGYTDARAITRIERLRPAA